jgi:hypothetical protein
MRSKFPPVLVMEEKVPSPFTVKLTSPKVAPAVAMAAEVAM